MSSALASPHGPRPTSGQVSWGQQFPLPRAPSKCLLFCCRVISSSCDSIKAHDENTYLVSVCRRTRPLSNIMRAKYSTMEQEAVPCQEGLGNPVKPLAQALGPCLPLRSPFKCSANLIFVIFDNYGIRAIHTTRYGVCLACTCDCPALLRAWTRLRRPREGRSVFCFLLLSPSHTMVRGRHAMSRISPRRFPC